MRIVGEFAIVSATIFSQSGFAQDVERFISEGSCSCKVNWDCLESIRECSEFEANRNAASYCPAGIGAVPVTSFEHGDCPAGSKQICDVARAEFVCGW
jgi:hypothetical protein